MNIHAEENDKVIVTEETINYGYTLDKEQAKKYLTIGQIYNVDYTVVGDWHTDVYLKEFPTISFNSVNFDDYK
jgi:hypothetical protein